MNYKIALIVCCCFGSLIGAKKNVSSFMSKGFEREHNVSYSYSENGQTLTGIKCVTGVGFGVDIADRSFLDDKPIKTSSDIFDANWLDDIVQNGVLTRDTSCYSTHFFSSDIQSMAQSISSTFSHHISDNVSFLGSDKFGASIKNGFSITTNIEYSRYISQLYYYFTYNTINYSYSLPNIANIDNYRNHLDSSYIQNVSKLFNNEISYAQFTNLYGTHVIGGASFGGRCHAFYRAFTNETSLENVITADMENSIRANFELDFVNVGAQIDQFYSLAYSLNTSALSISEVSTVYSKGGIPFRLTYNNGQVVNEENSWLNSIEGREALTRIDNSIPLWELLPSEYDTSYYKSLMINMFSDYANQNGISYDFEWNLPNEIKTTYQLINSNEVTVTDRALSLTNSPHFSVPFYDGFYPSDFVAKGYYHISFIIHCDMKEVDDGYQKFYFYNSDNFTNEDNRKCSVVFSFNDGNGAGTNYLHEDIYVNSVSHQCFMTNRVVLVLAASGNFSDTWKIKNTTIDIIYSKQPKTYALNPWQS